MNNLLKEVLSMSLSGALLILLIISIRPLLRDKFTKAWQYYIWIIVLIRLLVPFSPEFGIVDNLFHSLSRTELTTAQPNSDTVNQQTSVVDSQNASSNNADSENLAATHQNDNTNFLNFWKLGGYLWLSGIAIWFAIKMIRYLKFLKFIKNSSEPIAEKRILQIYKRVAEELGIIERPQLKLCSQIASPMLIGLLRPSIYLTEVTAKWDDSSLYYVLRHELMHFKRHDLWYKWSSDLILCIHWFNPLVYIMNRNINSQCETSCDEAVARNLSPEEKKDYGNVLLNAVSENLKNTHHALYSTLYEDKKSMKERLKAIIMAKQKSKKTIIPTIIVTLVLCAAAFMLGAYTMNGGKLNNGTKANAASGQTAENGNNVNSADNSADQAVSSDNVNPSTSSSDTSLNNTDSQEGNESSQSGNSGNAASDNPVSGNSSTGSTSGNSPSDNSGGDKDAVDGSGNSSSNNDSTILYSNTDFGFDFALPSSWKGYTILKDTWQGTALNGKNESEVTESGTKLIIRHPEWTEDVPRQDIPIMVFTKDQWDKVVKEELAVSAAPIGPSKLGSNSKYIFALPARYNFAYPEGYEEVENIMENSPLTANESYK